MQKYFYYIFFLLIFFETAAQRKAEKNAWVDFINPGQMHAMLARDTGIWREDFTMWPAPNADPAKYHAIVHNRMILDGRYQESIHEGNFMGMPYRGYSVTGYDNAKECFVNMWMDNLGTGMLHSEGKWNPATRTIEYIGNNTDPYTKKETRFRQIVTYMDKDHQKIEMFVMLQGKEFKNMEILLTRQY